MKVFLGNIPWYKGDLYGVRAGSRWPHFQKLNKEEKVPFYMPFPFFLGYAAAVLEREKSEVLLVDGVAEGLSREEFTERIKSFSPDLILFETSTPTINYDLKFIKNLRKEYPGDYKIALSGPHSEMYKQEFLEKNKEVDFVLVGEYEMVLKDLSRVLAEGKYLSKVSGLIFRGKKGEVKVNERRPLMKDINRLPYPARHFLPMRNYQDLVCGLPAPSLQMWASRGCPYGCIFCFWPQVMYQGSSYRTREPKLVIDELEEVLGKYDFKSFYFDDDTFNLGKERIIKLCEEIKERGIKLPWAIMARADTMDKEMLRALKEAGLHSLKYGMESVVQEIVDNSGKNLDLQKAENIIAETKNLGIKVHLTFAFGLPGETKETVKRTIAKIIELCPDSAQFSIATPFPGSKYFEILKRKGLIYSYNWDDYNGSLKAVFRSENLTIEDLEGALNEAKVSWAKRFHTNFKFKEKFKEKLKDNLKQELVDSKNVKRILIFRSSYIEHAQSAVEVCRKVFNRAQIDLLIQPGWQTRFKGRLLNFVVYTGTKFDLSEKAVKFVKELSPRNYDACFILYNNLSGAGYDWAGELTARTRAKQIFALLVDGSLKELEEAYCNGDG